MTVSSVVLKRRLAWRWRQMNSQGSPKLFGIYPLGTLNMCTKIHSNSCNSCQEISLKNGGKVKGSPKSLGCIVLEHWMSVQDFPSEWWISSGVLLQAINTYCWSVYLSLSLSCTLKPASPCSTWIPRRISPIWPSRLKRTWPWMEKS